jgi:hypothetical protein
VRRLTGPTTAGFSRVAWDLRYPQSEPTSLQTQELDPWDRLPAGPFAAPGRYTVSLAKRVRGVETPLGQPQTFAAIPSGTASLPPSPQRSCLRKDGAATTRGARRRARRGRSADTHRPPEEGLADAPPRTKLGLRFAPSRRLKDVQIALTATPLWLVRRAGAATVGPRQTVVAAAGTRPRLTATTTP